MSFGLIGSAVATGLGASATTAAAVGAGTAFLGAAASGGDSKSTESTQAEESTTRKRLELDQPAIDKIVGDVLGSEKGLADIFSKENVAGIYDSTVAAQASGDLVANLLGELAKLTATEVTEETGTVKKTAEEEAGFIEGGEAGLDLFRKILNLDVAPSKSGQNVTGAGITP